MTRADLATLIRAIAGDRSAAARHAALALKHAAALADDDAAQTVVAASLHHFYAAVEALTERVLRGFGQTLPEGPRWHQELLELAALDVPGVRPAVFSEATARRLRKLLAFRHFFRHAYAAAWDPDELSHNVAILRAVLPAVDADLDRLTATLEAAVS